ncbi:HAMP domain-containing sensor histidine kinase [Amycolatopsis samaneae]
MPRWLRGLRVRLILAFVLVTVLGAAVAAWASYASTSTSLVDEAQQRAVTDVRHRVGAITADLTMPPDQATLDRLRTAVGAPAMATYRQLSSSDGMEPGLVTAELRGAVRDRRELVMQRVAGPKLIIGTPVLTTALDGTRSPSGIEVYVLRDLAPVQQQMDASARSAALTSALALPLAILLALLAARGVLRPVREMRTAARRLAVHDLSTRLRVRGVDELADLAGTFNHMAAELQGSVAELRRMESDARRFVADVSHELRTPLTTLTAVVEVLEDETEAMSPNARASALLAVQETRKLTRLVEDLIEVSRFDAGAARTRPEEVELRQAVTDCLRSRGWLDAVELDAPEPIDAVLDRRRFDVVVANLVGNALRHGEPPVRLRLRADEREVEVEVTDHGPGLPGDLATRVFERFYKADAARTRSEGSGLGLAIAAENARLHGGDIAAGNLPGAGARFVLRLPRYAEEVTGT